MRVISGQLSGRIFDSPKSKSTHPMAEKVRGGLFNSLGDISGMTVLDAYAGSGAVAIEAISRGASHAVAVENDKQAYRTIIQNVEQLGLHDSVDVFLKQITSWVAGHRDMSFDIVIADPPYTDLRRDVLLKIALRSTQNGLFVLSWPGREKIPPFSGFKLLQAKAYGDAQLIYYVRATAE